MANSQKTTGGIPKVMVLVLVLVLVLAACGPKEGGCQVVNPGFWLKNDHYGVGDAHEDYPDLVCQEDGSFRAVTKEVEVVENPPTPPIPPTDPTEATWPETPEEAATLFGADASRWEVTPDGGWHLMEAHDRIVVNPAGFTGEGYYDTNPGKDPRQMVFVVAMEVQGCTIWPLTPDNAQELFDAMAGQKGYDADQANRLIDKVGW
jgi:hypothetical protein